MQRQQSEEEIYKIMEGYASLRMWAHCLETWPRETRTPPAGLEPAIFGLEVRRLSPLGQGGVGKVLFTSPL